MAIPTVPGSEIDVATPNRAAHLDAGALTAPARATLSAIDSRFRGGQQTAGAIEGVGAELGGLADDMLKVHRANVAADSDFRMRAAQQSFLESIRNDQNEHDWTDRAAAVADQTRQDIFASHNVPPGMRPELENSIKSWGQALQIKTQTLAQVQSINRAELSIRKSYDEAGRDGDAIGMANAVALGRSSKLDPVAMDEMEQNIPRALATTAIENGLANNPKGTLDLLKSGASLPIVDQHGDPIVPSKVYSPQELERKIIQAHTETSKWQTDNLLRLESTSADGDGIVPEEVIRGAMNKGEINALAGENKIRRQKQQINAADIQQNQKEFGAMEAAIHDPLAWEDPEANRTQLLKDAEDIHDPISKQRAINDTNRLYAAALVKRDKTTADVLKADIRNLESWGVDLESAMAGFVARAQNIGNAADRKEVINYADRQKASILKKGKTVEQPVEKEIYAQMKADRANALLLPLTSERPADPQFPGQLTAERIAGGMKALTDPKGPDNPNYLTDDMIKQKFGAKMTRERLIAAERSLAASNEQKMALFFKGKPDATYDEANAYRKELEKPYVMDRVKQALSPGAPPSARTERPATAAFYSKSTGKWYDKDKKEIP